MTQVRLLSLAGFLALSALVLLWADHGGRGVQAAVSSVTPAGNGQFLSGTSLAVAVSAEDDRGALIITASGAIDPKITVTGCTNLINIFYCTGTVTGDGTASVSIDTDILDVPDQTVTVLRVTLTLTATCASNTPISLVAQQRLGFQQPTNVSVAASPQIICTVPAPALTFTGLVNPSAVGCGGRAAIIFNPVGSQTAQTLYFAATTGSVAPASVAFSGSGAISTFFTAPLSAVSASATITLQTAAGIVVGSASVTTSCGAAVTATSVPAPINTAGPLATPVLLRPTAPPPTAAPLASAPQTTAPPAAAPVVVISPPNTGDGGLLLGR